MRKGTLADVNPIRAPAIGQAPIADANAPGTGMVWRQAAAVFQDLSRDLFEYAGLQAQAEGAAAGREAGGQPGFKTSGDLTIRGRAFDEAGLTVARAKTEVKVRGDMDALFEEFKDNPAELQKRLDDWGKGYGQGVIQALKADFDVLFARGKTAYLQEAGRRELVRQEEQAKAALFVAQDAQREGALKLAQTAALDRAGDAVVTGAVGDIRNNLIANGPKTAFRAGGVDYPADDKRTGVLSPLQIEKGLVETIDDVSSARVMGAFVKAKSLDQRKAMLEQAQSGQGFATKLRSAARERLAREMETAIAQEERRNASAAADIARMGKGLIDGLARGVVPTAEAKAQVKAVAIASGSPEALAQAQALDDVLAKNNYWRLQSTAKIDARVLTLKALGAQAALDDAGQNELIMLENLAAERAKQIAKDPVAFGVAQGIVTRTQIDWAAPDAADQYGQRAEQMARAAPVAGQPLTQTLTAGEARALTAIATDPNKSPEDRATFLGGLVTAAGRYAPRLVQQLAGKDAGLAWAATLAEANPAAAAKALAGQQQIIARPELKPEPKNAAAAGVADVMQAVFQRNPQSGAAFRAAADRIYAQKAVETGAKEFTPELYREAMDEALGGRWVGGVKYGGLTQFNGAWTAVPSRMTQDQFDQVLDKLTDAALEAGGGARPVTANGKPVSARDVADQGYWIAASEGRYWLSTTNPTLGAARIAQTADGKPFILDIGKAAAALKKTPDARSQKSDDELRALGNRFGGIGP